jgi:Leucine-rich repeat (LRR) protein
MLPDEIQHLTYLQSLHIANNPAMGGSVPSSVRQLGGLQRLALPGCSIVASFPDWMGDMTQLKVLDLSRNRLRGSMPSTISRLTNLNTLLLGENLLDATLDIFQPLKQLHRIEIQYNLFNGNLDSQIFSSWTQLVHFNASANQLSGSLPENLLGHSTLREIDLRFNRFSGTIPDKKFAASSTTLNPLPLEYLALDWNELEGPLPIAFIPHLVELKVLGVSSNLLTGTISESMSSLKYLESLSLGSNKLDNGSVPSFLWRMTALQSLDLSRAGLTGTIPESIGFLSTLTSLDFSWNSLIGSLPDEMSLLTDLGMYLLLESHHEQILHHYDDLYLCFSVVLQHIHLTCKAILHIEGNQLTGDADPICQSTVEGKMIFQHFTSDCEPGMNGSTNVSSSWAGALDCACCDVCCSREGRLCV